MKEAEIRVNNRLNAIQQDILAESTNHWPEKPKVARSQEVPAKNWRIDGKRRVCDHLVALFSQTGCPAAVTLQDATDAFINVIYSRSDKIVLPSTQE